MSTILLIERMPTLSIFARNHCGLDPLSRCRFCAGEKWTFAALPRCNVCFFVGPARRLPLSLWQPERLLLLQSSAEISRASPKWLSKSPRFGVISTSRIVSAGKRSRSARQFLHRATKSTGRTHLRRDRARSGCKAFLPTRRRAVCFSNLRSVRQLRAEAREELCRRLYNSLRRKRSGASCRCHRPLRKRVSRSAFG